MDFKSLLAQLDQLNEATEKTKTGVKHTAEPGGYGRKDDEDDEGKKVKADAPKKGKGRPKKDADASGETKKYDFSAFGVKSGKDVKLPKYDKKKSTVVKGKSQSHAANKVDDGTDPGEEPKTKKKGLKEYFDSLDRALLEAEQIQIKPASNTQTQVIQQGNKTLGTVNNPQLAQQIKQSIGKGEMSLNPNQEMHEEDIGKHNNATTGFDALVRKLTPKYGVEAAKRIAGAQLKKIREADMPPNDSNLSPIGESRTKADDKAEKAGKKVTKDLEYDMKHKGKDDNKAEKAGKKVTKDIEYDEKKKTVKEAAKPDFPDIDNDGNKKETISKAAQDAKKDKKKVKEGMDHRLKAARHMGKAHALTKEGYNCRYDDMEEAKHYHEGYKEGLDECYGQMPIQGYVGETNPPATVPGMANQAMKQPAMEDDLDEMDKGDWMKHKAKSTPGDTFKAFGQTFKDKEVVESPFAFEALEQQLNALLEAKEEVAEGMTVSISKGQQGMPDSVSVNAQDAEADQLLSIIKQAGLGLFGGDEQAVSTGSQPMSVAVDSDAPTAEIDVVDDHDDMLSLIRKMTGQGPAQAAGDYEEEGGEHAHSHEEADESTCEACGESACGCDDGKEPVVDEDESMDQREYEVAEEIDPNNDDEAQEEQSDATRDAALAQAADNNEKQVDEGGDGGEASSTGNDGVEIADTAEEAEEDLEESYANSDDDTFETDIDFMTKVISGGLNKQKSTGQTTQPVIAGQNDRMGYNTNESVNDWKKLAGIK